MAKLNSGDPAPGFTLETQTGEPVSLENALGKGPVVLIFYPMDNTPGCTAQLCAVRDDSALYAAAGVTVYGVNGGDAGSHQKFIAKHNLTAPLLIDKGLKVATDYDAVLGVGPLKMVNRTVVGIARDGTIAFYKRGSPSTDEILRAIGATPA
jgi:peroxiredoxin Q/BCP